MTRVAVVIGPKEIGGFKEMPEFLHRVQCYPGVSEQRAAQQGLALVFTRDALPPGFSIPGDRLFDVGEKVRANAPVNPAHLGNSTQYLEYRPA